MMKGKQNYYEILGVARSASDLQIKRRYRQLVRKYHPDVAGGTNESHSLFVAINEAYQVLSDPIAKKQYDSTLSTQSRTPSGQYKYQSPSQKKEVDVNQLIKNAQWAFIQRRFNDAGKICAEIIKKDPRNAKVHAILGDIYRAQKKINMAIKAYSVAVQYNPNDRESERKLTDLLSKQIGDKNQVTVNYNNPKKKQIASVIGWAVALMLIVLMGVFPGEPIDWFGRRLSMISVWSFNLMALIALASVVTGIMLKINGALDDPNGELIYDTQGGGWEFLPTGIILIVGSWFNYIIAAIIYLTLGFIQNSISRSVLILLAGVAGVVFLSALSYQTIVSDPNARLQVLLFGGNVSLTSMVIGWYIGSAFSVD